MQEFLKNYAIMPSLPGISFKNRNSDEFFSAQGEVKSFFLTTMAEVAAKPQLKEIEFMKLLRMVTIIIIIFSVVFVSSCDFFPDNFKAKLHFDKNGTYTVLFVGILNFFPAYSASLKGILTKKDDPDMIKLKNKLLKDGRFNRVEHLGNGKFAVFYKNKGKINPPMHFLSNKLPYLSVSSLGNNKIEIRVGAGATNADREFLNLMKVKLKGKIQVSTNGKVISQNCDTVPSGPQGEYAWQIKSVDSPFPRMVIQLK